MTTIAEYHERKKHWKAELFIQEQQVAHYTDQVRRLSTQLSSAQENLRKAAAEAKRCRSAIDSCDILIKKGGDA